MTARWVLVWLGAWGLVGAAAAASAPPAAVLRAGRHLLLDPRVVESVDGARLVPGPVEKEPRNPLFTADRPWENALNNLYPNVDEDPTDGTLRLWYKCVLPDADAIRKMEPPFTIHNVGWFLCYATSRDGIAWTKPELGIYGFDGSKRNNVVARDSANVGVFRDAHDPDASRRYKMICDVGFDEMRVRFSPDGLHWSEPQVPEGLKSPAGRVGDTHNNAFWDARQGKYVLLTRIYAGERLVARSESRDFLHWSEPRVVLRSTAEEGRARQTYCMPAFPYAEGYLGYVMMYNLGKDRTVDCELAWSPDSVHWQRVTPGIAFIPRGVAGSYDAGCIYAPAGPPILRDHRLWIYYGGSAATHTGWKRHCLPCLARLRVDGFAGYEGVAAGKVGTVTTRPMRVTEETLTVTADAARGSLRVVVLDAGGKERLRSEPIASDGTDLPVRWQAGGLGSLRGTAVRLRFEIRDARLYSFGGLARLPG